MDWRSPFNVNISFIKELFDAASADDFARTLTASDEEAFASLSPQNLAADDLIAKEYLARWDMLSASVWECCSALPDWIKFVQECVQVRLPAPRSPTNPLTSNPQALLTLRNYHSAIAILAGLLKYSTSSSTLRNINGIGMVTPTSVLPPDFLYLMNPFQNYAAYRQQFEAMPGLPFLVPHINQAKQQGPVVLQKLFRDVGLR